MSRRPDAAAAAVVGAAAAAVLAAAGLVGARRRRTRAVLVDSLVRDAPPPLSGRQRTVVAEDGVELAVTEHGSAQAAATFVLLHGHAQSGALWAGQVRDLLAARQHLRVITYHHRGHGGSGRADPESADLELLGRDLERVLDSVAPTGPVLLAGHATGGTAIMALAEQAPELFGQRIAGVALVATCSGALEEAAHLRPTAVAALTRRLRPLRGDSSAWSLPSPAHDRLAVRTAMAELPVLVVVGDQDRLCPLAHSRALAGALRAGELVVYPGAGHLVPLERRAEVSRRLLALLDRALARRDVAAVH